MKSYKYVLLDLDNTLYDTRRTERLAMQELICHYAGDRNEPELYELYRRINAGKWQLLETGDISIAKINLQRFHDFFLEAEIKGDWQEAAAFYIDLLAKHHKFLPGAEEIYRYLTEKYQVALITNGLKEAQIKRIKGTFMDYDLTQLFAGEDLGIHKPAPEVISIIRQKMNWQPGGAMILIGDSLQSDVKCAMNAEIDSIWCNFLQEEQGDYQPVYTVTSLHQIKDIL
ncbi:MAG: YjjG family noncanonical pyrimidine nucleotidase [Candidatus Cloacimonetes bacterium]|nr:YjjG family noncanonical pyrimidine nucleotidase [Candidatus Cloacimonadota bacterium]